MIKVITRRVGNASEVLAKYRREKGQKLEFAHKAVGTKLLEFSNEQCPTDTGMLKDSGRVGQQGQGFGCIIYVGYGGVDIASETRLSRVTGKMVDRRPADYAIYVHEDASMRHDIGKHDFLWDAITLKRPELRQVLKDNLKGA